MKYLIITAIIFVFSQNIYADEVVTVGAELDENSLAAQQVDHSEFIEEGDSEPAVSTEESYKNTKIEFSKIGYYEFSDNPDYKPRNRILLGGIVPFIPIRSTIDKSVEEPELIDRRVSFMLYFKQNF